MDKKIKKNLKNAFDDIEDYKDFGKSEVGKNSIIFLICGLIMVFGGAVGYFIVLGNEVKEQAYDLLSLLFFVSILGAFFGGIYLGQIRHYHLTKKSK